jgi:hypothetical protein
MLFEQQIPARRFARTTIDPYLVSSDGGVTGEKAAISKR